MKLILTLLVFIWLKLYELGQLLWKVAKWLGLVIVVVLFAYIVQSILSIPFYIWNPFNKIGFWDRFQISISLTGCVITLIFFCWLLYYFAKKLIFSETLKAIGKFFASNWQKAKDIVAGEVMDKGVNDWTKKELEALPERKWGEDIGVFYSMVILPTKHMHDSDYRCMDFVAVGKDQIPIKRLSGCSDVLDFEGIGGYGKGGIMANFNGMVKRVSWSIDCLKKSKLLRVMTDFGMTAGEALSSFCIYTEHK